MVKVTVKRGTALYARRSILEKIILQ